ncbi:MAG: SusC/RagA family TonB-linked outer membrane protein, partial [Bacteroides sp.]
MIDNISVKSYKNGVSIEETLKSALEGTGLSFVIKGNDIVLIKSPQQPEQKNASATKTIKGKIVDAETGEPIIGAQIWVKETSEGSITDIDGNFSIKTKTNLNIIVVSYTGYKKQELSIKENQDIICKLKSDSKLLDEVVVVGYGTQKKESVVGSISSIKMADLKVPVANISSSLGGKLSGVITLQKNNEPGASTEFWIRGISTFGSNKTPLVLVDGIERDMDLVNVEDIESFSILKDAAATAIYGVRGANGVVLITTRVGEEGRPKISFRAEAGLLGPTQRPKMVNSLQFAEMYNEAIGSKYYDDKIMEQYRTGADPDLYPSVNWLDELYKDYASSQRFTLGVSGGGSIAKYYISGAFYNEGSM